MFRFLSLRNSLLSSSLIAAGKALTIFLVVCLFFNPTIAQSMTPGIKTAIGVMSLVFAGMGLFSCCFGFSRVLLVAGFWIGAMYLVSSSLLGSNLSSSFFSKSHSIPKVLPGGLMYEDIPDNTQGFFSTKLELPSTGGMMDKLYAYVSAPVSEAGSSLSINNLGFGSASFADMKFNSGVLPDEAFFPKKAAKRNYYPIKDQSKDSGIMGLLQMLPIK